mmetsp:Transcript_1242/g.2244  ORF Transcript_1242/g.2244 Transcript_1242/m.2244 type:complete len:523 (+) Transcript_1242:133-1701(+)|eukprot:CAMPEP_0176485354 /NCGR_PEP_ID=MMETSP0200_2-20121128/4994_1 /TAXON_ID=947934 /ORGANISM="Chaetoceros sp., Strain GSL56" /LENGTH=522 /DNA_ID=CAMNT_0017881991 /DNA_START=249 /DNA_END=1817 /DNA_ORIENTATION=+
MNDANIDVMNYISRYDPKSETRIQRLMFLIRNGKGNAQELPKLYALLQAQLIEAGNVKRYHEVFGENSNVERLSDDIEMETSTRPAKEQGREYKPSNYGFLYDQNFVESATITTSHQLATLETNLRTSRSSLARDAILQASMQLAKHLISTGNSAEAMHQLAIAKSYCSSKRQIQDLFLLLAETGLNCQNYKRVKELYDPSLEVGGGEPNPSFLSKLNAARGVAYLAEGKMKEAARSFLSITNELTNDFNRVLSLEDIALYGGLSALLAMDRKEMEVMVMSSPSSREKNGTLALNKSGTAFGERLEVIPHLKEAIEAYIRADYAECLSMVEKLRGLLEIDMYLAPQSKEIWEKIRGKCLIQYFEPYSSVSLHDVMESFSFDSMEQLEDVIADFVERKEIRDVRIDGVNKVLNRLTVEQLERRRRKELLRKLSRMGDGLINEVEGMLLRTTCVQRGVVIGGSSKHMKGRRRDWVDVLSSNHENEYALQSSDEDGEGKATMVDDDEEEIDMMEIDENAIVQDCR